MKQQKTSNFYQALWLFISQCNSLALVIVSAAVLSRYFTKSEYGTYKQVMYVYATLHTVFVAGLPGIFSYFIPRLSDGQGKTLVNRFTLVLGFLGALFSIVLFFGAPLIAQALKNPELTDGLKIFALVPLFTLPTLGVEGIYTALRKTNQVAFYQIVSKSFNLLCVIAPVFLLGGSYKTAIAGWTVASLLIFIFALWMKSRPYVSIKPELIPNMYKSVFGYSLPLMGASIVGMFLHAANQFFVSRYYGTVIFAEFSNGYISVPFIGMIAGSVKNVLTPLFSKANFEGNIQHILLTYKNSVVKVADIVFPLLLFCMFFAKDIMIVLYGNQYAVSTIYFQIAILKEICEVLPYLAILLAFGKSNVYFYIHLFAAICIWTVNAWIVYNHFHPAFIAVASSVTQILMVSFVYWYFNHVLKIKLIRPIIKHILIVCLHASIILFAVYLIRTTCLNDLFSMICLFICIAIFYPILAISGKIVKINYLEVFITLFKKKL